MIVSTYRSYIAQLTAGIQFCRQYFGERYSGTIGLVSDLLAQGATSAILNHMPGHPEQAEDALNQSGSDAGLFRFRLETLTSWRARVSNPWPFYEQAGTPIQVLRAVNEWGTIMFSATWDAALVGLTEGLGSTFIVWLDAGITPWLPAVKYGSGAVYGDPNLLYGISNGLAEDVDTLRRVIRKWKPMRSKAAALIVLDGFAYDEPGVTYDGAGVVFSGFAYDAGITYDSGRVYDDTFSSARVTV